MHIPRHIAIIMDGNGRWAKAKGLPRIAGHREGSKRVKEVVTAAKDLGVEALTIFAFSTENWDRPKSEIELLFSYLKDFLHTYRDELMRENIRFKVIGRRDRIDKNIIPHIEDLERLTERNCSFTFNVALDYGGRWDIMQAAKIIATNYKDNKISQEQITEDVFGGYLSLAGQPDPELLIRTSGEERISNFLLWNLAYTEFYFPQICWPDFNEDELKKAIEIYSKRERRFGKIHG
ncbi:MAG: isoprenyl transferase [Candidatus Omnitrophota bacterium]|nr:isoprenyl transferase [Candidatus Omnitrophota bacterium]